MKLTDTVTPKAHWTGCALLFVLAWTFWAFLFPEALSFQEQSQMFLFDKQYFADRILSGLSLIIGEFLIQFFNNVFVGAAIIASVYVIIVLACWKSPRTPQALTYKQYLWGYVVAIGLWIWMALTNVRFTDIVGLTNLLLILTIGSRLFKNSEGKRKPWAGFVYFLLFLLFGYGGHYDGWHTLTDWNAHRYDYLARQQDWDGIVEESKDDDTNDVISNAYINLACGMKGSLSSRGDDARRLGLDCAFPEEDGRFLTDVTLSDVYYYLGLIDRSNELARMANKTLPNHGLSVRMVKRIIETDIITRNYAEAREYLTLMQKTLFYRQWAEKNLALLGNEEAINRHSFYGYARRVRLPDDTVKADEPMDKVILRLINHNTENYLAIQYYLLIPQLEHNEKKYNMYLKFVEKKMQ